MYFTSGEKIYSRNVSRTLPDAVKDLRFQVTVQPKNDGKRGIFLAAFIVLGLEHNTFLKNYVNQS